MLALEALISVHVERLCMGLSFVHTVADVQICAGVEVPSIDW
jgi:hypothetical protein